MQLLKHRITALLQSALHRSYVSSQQAPGVIARPHNSREIYRQPSSWGCWEPGRPPESFPLSCPSSSLSSLLLLRCQQAPGPEAERKSGSRCEARFWSRKIGWGAGKGEGPGKPLLPHPGPGSGEGELLVPVDLRPTVVPAELFTHPGSREPASGASHRGPRGLCAEEGAGAAAAVAAATWAG